MFSSFIHRTFSNRFGKAWFTLALFLLLHIIDETLNGFLPVYNEHISRIKANTGIPFPTFTFPVWFTGLMFAEIWLLFLSRYALQGRRIMIFLAYPFAVIMFLNGLMHLGGSLYLRAWLPGIITAPFLLFGSVNLLLATVRMKPGKPIAANQLL